MSASVRRLTMLVVVIFSMSSLTVAKPDNGFPLSWLWSWAFSSPSWAQELVGLPVQPKGPGAPKHHVAADVTKANRGTGRAPDRVKGGVPAYQPFTPRQLRTGKTSTARTSSGTESFSALSVSSGAPQLDSRYPANNTAVSTLTPQLFARGHDPNNSPNTGLKYNFALFNDAGTLLAESDFQGSTSWTVPAGKLKWAKTYLYSVQVFDGAEYGTESEAFAFTTPVPQPALTSKLTDNDDKGFDPAIGNYTFEQTDAEIETAGPALELIRNYNSLDTRTTQALGRGWASILDSRATESKDANGNLRTVIVTYPDGLDVAFGRESDGTFTPPAGRFATFKSITGGYELVDKDATSYNFTLNAGGGTFKLKSVTDANGRALTVIYGTDGKPTRMQSASGRSLWFKWATPAGGNYVHVVEVATDPVVAGDWSTSKTWQYTYDNDKLAKVCNPTTWTYCHTYQYSWISQYSNAILNESPMSYWRLNEAAGASVAASSVLANTGVDNAVYCNVSTGQTPALDGSTSPSASFNGTSSYVQLPGKIVSEAAYQTISMWFKTTATNGVLFSYNEKPVTDGTTSGNYTPALYIGHDGKLRGQFWQGEARYPMTSGAAVNDGNWHHVTLSAAGSSQTLYLDGYAQGTLNGAVTPLVNGTNNVFVGAGFLGGDWPGQAWTGQLPARAVYFNGSISDVAYFDRALSSTSANDLFSIGKWPRAALTKVVRPSGALTADVTYDWATGKVNSLTDENGGMWTLGKPSVSGNSGVYSSSVLGGKPVDYYRLGDASGTTNPVNVVSGGQATYRNVTLGATGPFADAKVAGFNGSSSYVELPAADIPATGPNTISLWFNMPSGNWSGGVLYAYQMAPMTDLSNGYHHTPAIYVGTDGKVHTGIWTGDSNSQLVSPATVNDGKWHHIVLAAGDNNQYAYLDGVKIGHINATIQRTDATRAFLGAGKWEGNWQAHGSSVAGYFPGSIGEFAFYRSKLTEEQVKAQWDASKQATPIAVTKVAAGVTAIPMPVSTVEVTDPGGRKLSYSYDLLNGNRTVQERDALGNVSKWGYDAAGRSNLTYNPLGVMDETVNDLRGNVIQQITCQYQAGNKCNSVYYTYFPDATTTVLTPDPRNDVMLTARDGRSSSSTDNTYLTSYTYDAKGNRTESLEPGSKMVITYSDGTTVAAVDGGYVPAGLQTKVVAPNGAVEAYQYFKSGDLARHTDSKGKVTAFTYDGLGRKLSETEYTDAFPSGLVTSFTYDAVGRLLTQTEPSTTNRITGAKHTSVTTTTYDVDGLVRQLETADTTGGDATRVVKSTYNSRGQLETQTDGLGATTRYEYDAYGHMVKEIDEDGNVTLNTYDAEGNLLTTVVPGYDDGSGPIDLVEASNAYDPAGRLASNTDSMGWTTKYTYTDNGLKAKVTRADGTNTFVVQENTYDAAGELIQQVTGNGTVVTAYTYDAAGRKKTAVTDPNGLKRTTTFGYSKDDDVISERETDAAGNVVEVTERMFDTEDQLLAETDYRTAGLTPTGRWRLNGSGVDGSGNSPLKPTGTVSWSGDSATFDGNSRLTSPAAAVDTGASFSVSAWVYLTEGTTYRRAVAATGRKQSAFDLRWQPNNNRWIFNMQKGDTDNAGGVQIASTTAASMSTWAHLTATYDSGTGAMQLYVNGNLEASGSNPSAFTASGPLMIGAGWWNGGVADGWKGSVKDVQVYQKVLSGSEVTAIKHGTAPAADATVMRISYIVDNDGLVRSTVDPGGNVTDYTYDEDSRVTQVVGAPVMAENAGETPVSARPITTTGYDTFDHPTHRQDAKGDIVNYTYDAAGHVLSSRMPNYTPPGSSTPISAVATAAYDKTGQKISETDPLGNVTTFTYDRMNRLVKVTTPDLGTTTYTYDRNNQVLSVTDPVGAVTSSTYDYLGSTVTSSAVERQPSTAIHTTRYAYDSAGRPWKVTSPAGVVSETTYNAVGEAITSKDGANSITRFEYDGGGRMVKSIKPDGTYGTHIYDLTDRQLSTSEYSASGTLLAKTSNAYDAEGNLVATTDAKGTTTTYTYDAAGHVLSEREPISSTDAIVTSFGYDLNGQQTRMTDGRGNKFITTYNSWGLPESTIEPATAAHPNAADRTFTVAYDAEARITSATEPGGITITSTYDNMGRLKKTVGSGAEVATAERTFDYDKAGRVTNITGITLTYSDRDLLLTTNGPAGNSSFAYDADGRMRTRTDAAGTSTFTYDTAGRLATVDNPTMAVKETITYDAMSQLSRIDYGTTGSARSFTYDDLHRRTSDELKTASGATVGKITYGWDLNGNETSKTTTGFAGSAANTYTYDLADRLISWNSTTYAYDKSGNRTQSGTKAFTYDERNRLIGGNGTSYTYTPRGTLRFAVNNGVSLETRVDAFGQVLRQYASAAGYSEYNYDGLGRVIRDGFAYSGLANDLAADGQATYTRSPDGGLLGVAQGGTNTFAWTDLHTDVVGQFTATGSTLNGSITYDPLGKVLNSAGMLGNLGYQSEWTDSLTGRVNMHARWYNPETGQFDTRDSAAGNPVPNSIEANRYQYGNANPMTVTDPSGHWPKKPKWLSRAVKKVSSWARSAWSSVRNTNFSDMRSMVADKLRRTVKAVKTFKPKRFINHVKRKVNNWKWAKTAKKGWSGLKKYASKKLEKGRKWAAKQKKALKEKAKEKWNKSKLKGQLNQINRGLNKAANAVKDGYKATSNWVSKHKAEIAGFVVGAVVGIGCGIATGGAGAIGCGALAGAAGSFVTGAMKGKKGLALIKEAAIGGALGALPIGKVLKPLGSVLKPIVSKAAAPLMARAAPALASVRNGLTNLASKVPAAVRSLTNRNSAPGCLHSFDPSTKVLMADGSKKPISAIKVGDKVVATDPVKGSTEAKPVTDVHRNLDKDLTNVTVRNVETGKVETLKTTQHHPFWNDARGAWLHAKDLAKGMKLRLATTGTVVVLAVSSWFGSATMNDLTVADTHTYYVLAAGEPVLVHNCGPYGAPRSPSGRGNTGKPDPYVRTHDASDGWTMDSRLEDAAGHLDDAMRSNGVKGSGFPQQPLNRAWIAGVHTDTGRVAVACSGRGFCAEGNVVNALGGDSSKVVFTQAWKIDSLNPFQRSQKPTCDRCFLDDYIPEQFSGR